MRRHLTPSLFISLIALFVALGGASYAAVKIPKNSVGSSQLKKNAVSSSKVKNASLLAEDFKAGQLPRGEQGPKGDTGATGPKGDTGATGATGASGVAAVNGATGSSLGISLSGSPQTVMTTTVNSAPAGRMVVTGSFRMYNQASAGGNPSGSSCQVTIDGAPASQQTWNYAGTTQTGAEPMINNDWQVPVVGSAAVAAGTHSAAVVCVKVGPGTTVAYSGDLVAFVANS